VAEATVKIRVEKIRETEGRANFVEEVGEINEALSRTGVVDYQFQAPVPVDVHYYRLGTDLFFSGHFASQVAGTCARCLADYSFPLDREFTFVLKPAARQDENIELKEEDLALSFYQGDEVDLGPLVREVMFLALPTRPLCRDDCLGLCPRCGANRNAGACECRDEWTDPRLEILRTLKR
jgi:DUF177 domain-containing protein